MWALSEMKFDSHTILVVVPCAVTIAERRSGDI
jgi:hypothetical protein